MKRYSHSSEGILVKRIQQGVLGLNPEARNRLNAICVACTFTMEMRVDLLNKQEMMRLQSNAELMKILQDLSKQLKESISAILRERQRNKGLSR